MTEYTVLITGAGGQLGQELVRMQKPGLKMIGLDRKDLDITNATACEKTIRRIRPDAIIHAAAYTAVDKAESEQDRAFEINVAGTRNVVAASESVSAKLCYISTDYVFDGASTKPYRENDPTNPQSVYGRTKLEGEQVALETCNRTFIVRTSWLYGKYGSNFVYTMLRLAEKNKSLKVVNDQSGCPTFTYDLAGFLIDLIQTEKYGIYHASNSGICTWFEFAQTIFEESGANVEILPCTSDEFPSPAKRPTYSVLSHEVMKQAGFKPLRHWREALREFLR